METRSNILGNVPERLAVSWPNSRKTPHGWEVPIRVASADPSQGLGNTILIVHLGGPGGTSGSQADVEATAAEIVRSYNHAAEQAESAATHCPNCEHLFSAVQDAGKRSGDVWRIADSIGVAQRDDEDTYQWLERSVRELQAKARRTDRRPRIFTFANGCEIDVDRYLGLDATATRDGGSRPSITFQLGHGGFLRVVFESEQQRADELARLRAFRDGVA